MRRKPLFTVPPVGILAGLLILMTSSAALTDGLWRTRGTIQVTAPGITEAVVPPQLIYTSQETAGNTVLDLSLTDPDGNARAFELYWRDPVETVRRTLSPSQVTLDGPQGFIWEAVLTETITARQLIVQLAGREYVGKIDVHGYSRGRWQSLVRNAAIFNAQGTLRGQIDLPAAVYERLRLTLTSMDRKASPKLSPIDRVTVVGEKPGKNFAEQTIAIPFQQAEEDARTVVEAALPGNGLAIQALSLVTEAQFQGAWQLGRETITGGRKSFTVVRQGAKTQIDQSPRTLAIDLSQPWAGNSLVIKLDTGQRYIGAIMSLQIRVRLPRLVFAPEKHGTYSLITGTGAKVPIGNHPGSKLRHPDQEIDVGAVEINSKWQPGSLVERFQIKGAAFDPAGYTWRAAIPVPAPGYYQTAMNLDAVLHSKANPIRIVKDHLQVPYIQGRIESRTIELTAEATFDPKKNESQWIIQLPGPSRRWQSLILEADGIFRRTVRLQRPTPGNMSWQPWRTQIWENKNHRQTALYIALNGFPKEMDRMRMLMDHGDNQPITISKITVRYATPTFYFLAHQPGTYMVYGGNPDAKPPRYDLSLVEKELLRVLPEKTDMGMPEILGRPGWKGKLSAAFKDTGWGLYIVLGLVTLILLVVIVRLFPKADKPGPSNPQSDRM